MIHDVLEGGRNRIFQDVLQHIPAIAQAQIIQQRTHDGGVPGITDRAVIEGPNLPFQGVGTGFRQPAGRVEGFIRDAIEGKLLSSLEAAPPRQPGRRSRWLRKARNIR